MRGDPIALNNSENSLQPAIICKFFLLYLAKNSEQIVFGRNFPFMIKTGGEIHSCHRLNESGIE